MDKQKMYLFGGLAGGALLLYLAVKGKGTATEATSALSAGAAPAVDQTSIAEARYALEQAKVEATTTLLGSYLTASASQAAAQAQESVYSQQIAADVYAKQVEAAVALAGSQAAADLARYQAYMQYGLPAEEAVKQLDLAAKLAAARDQILQVGVQTREDREAIALLTDQLTTAQAFAKQYYELYHSVGMPGAAWAP